MCGFGVGKKVAMLSSRNDGIFTTVTPEQNGAQTKDCKNNKSFISKVERQLRVTTTVQSRQSNMALKQKTAKNNKSFISKVEGQLRVTMTVSSITRPVSEVGSIPITLAYVRVFSVSSSIPLLGVMFRMMAVKAFPPRLSPSTRVSFDSR